MWHLEDLYVGIIQSENLRVSEPWKIHQTPRPISQWVLGELPRMIYRSRGNRVNLKFSSMDYWFDPSFNADYWRKGTGQNWPKSLYFTRRTTHKNDRISQNVDELELCDYSADFNEWWLVLKIISRPFVILWWFLNLGITTIRNRTWMSGIFGCGGDRWFAVIWLCGPTLWERNEVTTERKLRKSWRLYVVSLIPSLGLGITPPTILLSFVLVARRQCDDDDGNDAFVFPASSVRTPWSYCGR